MIMCIPFFVYTSKWWHLAALINTAPQHPANIKKRNKNKRRIIWRWTLPFFYYALFGTLSQTAWAMMEENDSMQSPTPAPYKEYSEVVQDAPPEGILKHIANLIQFDTHPKIEQPVYVSVQNKTGTQTDETEKYDHSGSINAQYQRPMKGYLDIATLNVTSLNDVHLNFILNLGYLQFCLYKSINLGVLSTPSFISISTSIFHPADPLRKMANQGDV